MPLKEDIQRMVLDELLGASGVAPRAQEGIDNISARTREGMLGVTDPRLEMLRAQQAEDAKIPQAIADFRSRTWDKVPILPEVLKLAAMPTRPFLPEALDVALGKQPTGASALSFGPPQNLSPITDVGTGLREAAHLPTATYEQRNALANDLVGIQQEGRLQFIRPQIEDMLGLAPDALQGLTGDQISAIIDQEELSFKRQIATNNEIRAQAAEARAIADQGRKNAPTYQKGYGVPGMPDSIADYQVDPRTGERTLIEGTIRPRKSAEATSITWTEIDPDTGEVTVVSGPVDKVFEQQKAREAGQAEGEAANVYSRSAEALSLFGEILKELERSPSSGGKPVGGGPLLEGTGTNFVRFLGSVEGQAQAFGIDMKDTGLSPEIEAKLSQNREIYAMVTSAAAAFAIAERAGQKSRGEVGQATYKRVLNSLAGNTGDPRQLRAGIRGLARVLQTKTRTRSPLLRPDSKVPSDIREVLDPDARRLLFPEGETEIPRVRINADTGALERVN